jgi:hypothetical protein
MTAQRSGTQHSTVQRCWVGGGVWRWFIKSRASGVGRRALHQSDQERITPNVPTDGRGRGPRSYQATKILTPIAPVPQGRVLLSCTPPKRQRQREG